MHVFVVSTLGDISAEGMKRDASTLDRMRRFMLWQSDSLRMFWMVEYPGAELIVTGFGEGLVSEDGISITGWDAVEEWDNFLHETFPHWASFQ